MGTLTLNAKVDLTYEEIYEGYANGKSRLPKIIKDIENGNVALAEDTGVNILRRRTEGGNAETPGNVGQDNTTVVARLISAARFDALIAAYTGPGGGFVTPPSYNLQTVDVRAVVKNPFDLIDQVAGVNFANQTSGSAEATKTGREAKIQELGTGVRIRAIDTRAPAGATADIDVRDFFANDRIGGGGATGEVHDSNQGQIPDTVIVADSEGRVVGNTAAPFDLTSATALNFKLGATGSPVVSVVFDARADYTLQEVVDTVNAAVAVAQAANPVAIEFKGIPVNDPVCLIGGGGALELHSRNRGDVGNSGFLITGDNAVLGFEAATENITAGATAGQVDGIFEQTVVDLDPTASATRTTLRYGTAQFGVLQIVGTTNGLVAATASAYIVHPDFLEDLINF